MTNTQPSPASKPRILVVDDESNIRDMLNRHFRFLGYEVESAENGQVALKLMNEKRFEVVISDINMPTMSGTDFLRQVKINQPMAHVIMMTGYVTMDNVLTCMRLGADTCVFKPLEDMKELEAAVQYAVDHLKHWQQKLKVLIKMKP